MQRGLVQKCQVYISRSKCIYENLAFEDHLFRTLDLNNLDALLLWQNNPAVVIGRHQNPLKEVDLPYVQSNGICVARRFSGGGAVYHDLGNVNFSFLTSKQRHDRLKNVLMVADTVKHNWNIELEPSKRHDLLLKHNQAKISGTAARISKHNAYHHFTLLVDANLDHLTNSLASNFKDIECKSTPSVSARVACLREYSATIDCESVMQFAAVNLTNKYKDSEMLDLEMSGMHAMGLDNANIDQLKSWNWIFGKTPVFCLRRPSENGSVVRITVKDGVIKEIKDDSSGQEVEYASDTNRKLFVVGKPFDFMHS